MSNVAATCPDGYSTALTENFGSGLTLGFTHDWSFATFLPEYCVAIEAVLSPGMNHVYTQVTALAAFSFIQILHYLRVI